METPVAFVNPITKSASEDEPLSHRDDINARLLNVIGPIANAPRR
jgi:hypothetical protein